MNWEIVNCRLSDQTVILPLIQKATFGRKTPGLAKLNEDLSNFLHLWRSIYQIAHPPDVSIFFFLQGFRCQSLSVWRSLWFVAAGHTGTFGCFFPSLPIHPHVAAALWHAGSRSCEKPEVAGDNWSIGCHETFTTCWWQPMQSNKCKETKINNFRN